MAKDKKQKSTRTNLEKKKIHWGKISWYTFLVIILILFIVNNTRKDEGPQFQYPPGTKKNLYEPDNPENLPLAYDFTLKSIDGSTKKLSDFKDKIVVLDFWATWCQPCIKSIPDLIEIQKTIKDVQVIGISVDQNPMQVVPDFVKKYKINYPILIGTEEVYEKYGGINAIPTSFIIDKNGRIRNKHIGLVPKEVLIEEIRKAMN
ncbi:MAG: TlpA disulfide reductase family protein [Ignavibacteria bacterium]|jgi:thiol-disulfide isomerase/thioredoxin|nr:TlpA family protein disulfide reductase [Ignavibacteria bacterium]MDH7528877.1 TlpA disulfide reductase family protein [Ignavibacteria bacterium]NPV11345.1 TlpA family protein disulfide reductase [Ignavibacteria bacterium]